MYLIYLMNFLLATSTTIGMTLIPFIITDSLGLSLIILGLIEGSTEFLSNAFRLLNGILFDKIKNKRLIFVLGTALAFISKALLLLFNPWAIFGSKALERIANGMFASPRDALVALDAKNKGFALAMLNVSKAVGCILGPLIVSVSTLYFGNLRDNLHFYIFLCCSLSFPAFLLSFTVKAQKIAETPFSFVELREVLNKISPILLIAGLFFLGRFNDGLLMLYLKQQGFPEWFYLSTISIFNAVMIFSSPIIGKLIDKRYLSLAVYISMSALFLFNLCFFQLTMPSWPLAIAALLAWGIQRSSSQIVFGALVFKSVRKENFGTAIGIFYILSGLATMFSAFICGYLANTHFPMVFLMSGFFAATALLVAWYFFNTQNSKLTLSRAALEPVVQ